MQNSERQSLQKSQKSDRNDPVENISSNQKTVSAAFENRGSQVNTVYETLMGSISRLEYQEMIAWLQEDGISIMKDFQINFRLSCVKTDWESTVYQIRYARFLLFFKLISIDLKAENFCGPASNSGNFGEIVIIYPCENSAFALKNIKIQQNSSSSIDLAFQQIFIAKVASALRVGPKFEKILSYDAVLYQDCLQFAMQVCDTRSDHPVVQKESQHKNLLKILKTLHFFHICHMDIKNDNIAWSPAFNKLVLLDFGFSEIVKEPVGYKTNIKFKGSFKYCSPEMKRLFILKEGMKIDLYYNDLHCLQVAWKNMKANDFSPENRPQNISSENQDFSQDLTRNNLLVRYFFFKMNIFMGKFGEIITQIKVETDLIQTFKKIIQISLTQHKNDPEIFSTLEKAYLILTQKFKKMTKTNNNFHSIDDILLQIEKNKQNYFPSVLYRQIVEASNSDEEFAKIWNVESWKQQIFFFVDIYSSANECRQKLVQKIYRNIANVNQPLKQSYTMKFREVLIYYRDYFAAKKNTAILERILAYFMLLKDSSNSQHTEAIILGHWEEQTKYTEYLRENMKYFVAKMSMMLRDDIQFLQINIQNATKILKKISQIPQDKIQQRQQGQKILQKMKLIKIILQNNKFFYGRVQEQAIQKLELSNQQLWNDAQTLNFLKMVFRLSMKTSKKQDELSEFFDVKYQNFYLEKCAFIQKLQNNFKRSISQISLNALISSERFFSQFLSYENLFTLSTKKQREIKLRSEFCQDIGQIFLRQNPLQNVKLLRIYVKNSTLKQIEQMSLDLLTDFDLESIQKVQHISMFKNLLKCIMESFLVFKFGASQTISKQVLDQFSRITLDFLDFTSNLQVLKQGETCDESESQIEEIKKYANFHKMLRFIVFILVDREDEIIEDLLQTLETNLQMIQISYMTDCVFCLSVHKRRQLDQRLTRIILKQMQSLIKLTELSVLVYFPQFFQLALEAYRSANLQEQAMHSIVETFKAIHLPHFPITATSILQIATKFIQTSSVDYLQNIINIYTQKELKYFQHLPGMAYLVSIAHGCLITGNAELYSEVRHRVMMVCLSYAHRFSGLHFERYRSYLYSETYFFSRNPNKSTRIRHKRKLAAITQPKDSELLVLVRNRSKNPHKSQKRQHIEQTLMSRIKLYVQSSLK